MAETSNTPGIVLYYEPWRDYDRRYVLYTELYGKLRARALGIRKPTAKLAGVLEPFAETNLYLILGKQSTIGGAVVTQRFQRISSAKAKYNAAVYCSEVLDRLTKELVPDPGVYHLVFSTLTWLDHAPYSKLVPVSFVIKLVTLLGYHITDHKVVSWLQQATFADMQKLRLRQTDWQSTYQAVQLWLYEYLGDHVQSERFLV